MDPGRVERFKGPLPRDGLVKLNKIRMNFKILKILKPIKSDFIFRISSHFMFHQFKFFISFHLEVLVNCVEGWWQWLLELIDYLIEGMEAPLVRLLINDSGFLQQIILDLSPDGVSFIIKLDVHVLPESGTVVIPTRPGISKCFQDAIWLNEDVLDSLHFLVAILIRHSRDVAHNNFGGFSLSTSTFTWYHNASVLPRPSHCSVICESG